MQMTGKNESQMQGMTKQVISMGEIDTSEMPGRGIFFGRVENGMEGRSGDGLKGLGSEDISLSNA